MTLFYSVTRRATRTDQPAALVSFLRPLLLALLLTGPVGSWAQAPVFTQAVSFNPTSASGNSGGNAIALDAAGNQYITGSFSGTLELGNATLVSAGLQDIFVAKRNAATGAWLWAVRAGGTSDDYGSGLAVDAAGNALVTGSFSDMASFGSQTLMGSTFTGFVAALAGAGTLATAVPLLAAQATLFPNPAHTAFTLKLPPLSSTTATATLLNALGQTVSTRTVALAPGGTAVPYATAGLAPGLYTLRVLAGGEATALRVVVE